MARGAIPDFAHNGCSPRPRQIPRLVLVDCPGGGATHACGARCHPVASPGGATMRYGAYASCLIAFFLLAQSAQAIWGPIDSGVNNVVYALAPFEGGLIAGGAFTEAGGNPADFIARWDGSAWSALGDGVGGVPEPRVFALTVFEGELIAGGQFMIAGSTAARNIARWDGSRWAPLGGGVDGAVYALATYEGHLVAGGEFLHADGNRVNCIARWDGSSWSALGAGLGCVDCGNAFAVLSLGVHGDGALVAGGWFDQADGSPARYIAAWTGEWLPLGLGMDYPVSALIDFEGDLIAGGAFSHAGGEPATGIARWDGSSWHPLEQGVVGWYNWVRALAIYDGELIAGGYFVEAGGEPANHIARWNGQSWAPLEEGTDGSVAALSIFDERLIVGGSFGAAGGISASRIARWDSRAPGACCLHAYCELLAEEECRSYGGTFEGDGTECDPNPCPTSSVEGGAENQSLRLRPTPNPGSGVVRFECVIPEAGPVTIELFDAEGGLVRRVYSEARSAGPHAIVWDGRNLLGDPVRSGVYLARISVHGRLVRSSVVVAR